MGCQRLIVLTAFLLLTKDNEVSAQYATVVECLPPTTANIARPMVQSGGQFILPAIIQPIVPGYESYAPDVPASSPNYSNSPAQFPVYPPPIIIKEGNDMLRNLLYFMIFSMGNKKGNFFNTPPSYSGCPSCSGSGKCKCCCECSNCKKNTETKKNIEPETSSPAPIYIPIPIAIPVYTGPDGNRYIDGFCSDIVIQEPCDQSCNCNSCNCGKDANEINLIIKTDY